MKLIIDVPQMDRTDLKNIQAALSVASLVWAHCGRGRASRTFGPPHQRGGGHRAAHGAGRSRLASEPRPIALTHERAGVTRRGADGELRYAADADRKEHPCRPFLARVLPIVRAWAKRTGGEAEAEA